MSTLGQLKLVTAVKPQQMPEIVKRRFKLSNKMWEQIQLAKSTFLNQPFELKKVKTVKNAETGQSETISVAKRVRPWWFVADNGKVCLNVRYGNRVLELAKGKSAIEVTTPTELINTLELIRKAVSDGELDAQIDGASGAVKAGFKK